MSLFDVLAVLLGLGASIGAGLMLMAWHRAARVRRSNGDQPSDIIANGFIVSRDAALIEALAGVELAVRELHTELRNERLARDRADGLKRQRRAAA